MSRYSFVSPSASYALPASFDFREYIETERETLGIIPGDGWAARKLRSDRTDGANFR